MFARGAPVTTGASAEAQKINVLDKFSKMCFPDALEYASVQLFDRHVRPNLAIAT